MLEVRSRTSRGKSGEMRPLSGYYRDMFGRNLQPLEGWEKEVTEVLDRVRRWVMGPRNSSRGLEVSRMGAA